MTKHIRLSLTFCLLTTICFSQVDTTLKGPLTIFERISQGVKDYSLDTTAAPNDKITKKIIELRSIRGGFNINEVVDYKIEEDFQKNESSKADLEKLSNFFKSGNGKRWLDNATIWIYRKYFTYKELKDLVRFYKTPAGQKMTTAFPVIMTQSLRAAELIKEIYAQQKKK